MSIITIANQKGGVGKTTSVRAIAQGLAATGKRVLVIDLDSQRNLSLSLGAEKTSQNSLSVLLGECPAQYAVIHCGNIDLIPGTLSLAGAELVLDGEDRVLKLRQALQPIEKNYDYIICDTAPALSVLTFNAMAASDSVIIPARADYFSLQAIADISETISSIRKKFNKGLKLSGIVICNYDNRNPVQRDLLPTIQALAETLGTKVYKTIIRHSTAPEGAALAHQSLFEYSPRSNAAKDYLSLVNEILTD